MTFAIASNEQMWPQSHAGLPNTQAQHAILLDYSAQTGEPVQAMPIIW